MRNGDELIRQAEVSKIIGVTRSAVNRKIDAGFLEYVEIGGIRFVPRRAVKQWQQERAERARKLAELL